LCSERYQEPNTNAKIKALGLKNNFGCIKYKTRDCFSAPKANGFAMTEPKKKIVLK